jgi:uncharacterized protein DUF4410
MRTALALLIVACITISCASTEVTGRREYARGKQLQKPDRIIVYNFVATPGEIPTTTVLSGYYKKHDTPQTEEQITVGRELGRIVAKELVKEIHKMGMPAERAGKGPAAGIGDLLIKGAFVSMDEGSRMKRVLIGFGAGAGKLETHVEGYQITAEGLRLLGRRAIEAKGGKMPGLLVPVAGAASAGRVGAVVVAGGMNVKKELGPESLQGAAKRTAEEIANVLSQKFAEQGWFQANRAK